MANTLLEDKTTKLLHHMNRQIPYLKIRLRILHHMNLWQIPYLKIRLRTFSIIWTDKYLTLQNSPSYEPMANTLLEDKTTNLLHHMNRWQIPYLKIRLQNFSIIWTYGKYLTWRWLNILWQIPYLKIRLQNFSIIWTYGKYLTWR